MSQFSSWPGLSRPSTSCLFVARKTWMPGTSPGMTAGWPERPLFYWLHLSQTLRSREAASRRMAPGHMVRDGATRLLTMRSCCLLRTEPPRQHIQPVVAEEHLIVTDKRRDAEDAIGI